MRSVSDDFVAYVRAKFGARLPSSYRFRHFESLCEVGSDVSSIAL